MPTRGAPLQTVTINPQQFHEAAQNHIALAQYSPDGKLLGANPHYLDVFGIDTDELASLHHYDFYQPIPAHQHHQQSIWLKACNGESSHVEHERLTRSGAEIWLHSSLLPIHALDGTLEWIVEIAIPTIQPVVQDKQLTGHLENLGLITQTGDPAVLCTDSEGKITFINDGFVRMLGWTIAEIQGQDPVQLLSPQLHSSFVEELNADLVEGRISVREEIITGKSGQRYWAKIISNPVMADDGTLKFSVTTLVDITGTKLHEALHHRALEAMAREKSLTEVLNIICLEVERIAPEFTASILEVDDNGLLHPLAGPSLPSEYNQSLDGVTIGPNAGSCGTAAWRNESVRVDDIATSPLWEQFRDPILALGYVGCWSTPIRNSHGEVIGTFAFYFRTPLPPRAESFQQSLVDACTHLCTLALERELARRRIRQLAFYDELTGMPNRSLLHAKADQLLASSSRLQEQLAVAFINIDRFKQINDSLGRHAGDALLQQIAQRLNCHLHPADIAGRISGDEFAIVLPDCSVDRATDLVERIQALLGQPILIEETALNVSVSIGIAMFPSDGRDIETLLHRADLAMHQAKMAGRGQFRFFRSEMNQLAQERMMLENALRDAIHTEKLSLHYQPQVDLDSGRLYGVEALARWKHPTLGDISPAKFIPLAEDCGLIAELGRQVLHKACKQLATWRAQGIPVPSVSVNLSPTSFHNLELPSMIAETLVANTLQPEDLTVELTESVLLDTHPSTLKTLTEVHAQGVRLSMDDFGTGYSSLSYLRRLPVSELKLDRSFVADLEHDEAAQALSLAIIGIGKSLNLTVVAEGVENSEQNQILRQQGYPVAQGYLFSRPLPPEELADWLRNNKVLL